MNVFLGDTCKDYPSKVIAVIPARAGSKGLPAKNLLPLGGLPLVEHSIRLALTINLIDVVVVTTDSLEILLLRKKYPTVVFLQRPEEISQDTSTLSDAIAHVFTSIDLNLGSNPAFLILQPTSPFRLPSNITKALIFAQKNRASSMISVVPVTEHPSECLQVSHHDWHLLLKPPLNSTRRQDYTGNYYFISGSFYYSTVQRFDQLQGDCFNSTSSLWNSNEPLTVDIDTQRDMDLAACVFDYMTSHGYTFASPEWLREGHMSDYPTYR